MNTPLITCLALGVSMPLWADIKIDTSAPQLPPPPTGGSITLNPALVDKLTAEVGKVVQVPGQKTAQASQQQGAPPLSPLPGQQRTGAAPATGTGSGLPQPQPATATPQAAPGAPAAVSPTPPGPGAGLPAVPVPGPAAPGLTQAPGDSLALWYQAAESYGTDSMPVRLLGLLQQLNPDKPLTQYAEAYTAALRCHRLALSGNTAAQRQLAQAFESGNLAGLVFPQSLVASYFFLNRAQSTLPDLAPAPVSP